ncbi:protein NO VEIN domain-containing protein [Erythrobacter sp. W302b]|uniref:protein NO VEIN domain-containing protein n=1 Tax=Erythrobacter sp. W302b TaxID=3389874 RepID=UPI00396B2E32
MVGWYENATLMGNEVPRPEYEAGVGFRLDNKGEKFTFSIKSREAFFVPPEHRAAPFSHTSVGSAKFSYLAGPGIQGDNAKAEVLEILEAELARLTPLAIAQPNPANAPDELEDDIDPLGRFGTPEHRRAVELAAERAVAAELERMGYSVVRRSDEKIGYDLQAIPNRGDSQLYVEVKGTSGPDRRFYMTPKEREFTSTDGWRLAIVTDTLGNPDVTFFTCKQMEQRFSLQPMVWIGREVEGA